MEKTICFNAKEIDALEKVYLSASIGFEHFSLQNVEIHETLKLLFVRMGFVCNNEYYSFRELVFKEDDINKMIKCVKKMSYDEAGNLLYSVVEMRFESDPMGGQFSESFDLLMIYLLNKLFGKHSKNSIIPEISKSSTNNLRLKTIAKGDQL